MSEADVGAAGGRWHRALAQAITGDSGDEAGRQSSPDVDALARALLSRCGAATLAEHRREVLRAGGAWPHPVPGDLMAGLGYAQFTAALARLIDLLGLNERGWVTAAPPTTSMAPALRRLLDEVPPHHGS